MADEKKGITVKIDAGLHAEIRQYIEQNGMTMAEFVSQALYNELHPKIQPQEVKNMGPTRTMAFQMPEDMFQKLKDYLHRHNITQKQFVLGLVEAELKRDQELRAETVNELNKARDGEDFDEELDDEESEYEEEELGDEESEDEDEELDDEESEDEYEELDDDESEDEDEELDDEESEDEDEELNDEESEDEDEDLDDEESEDEDEELNDEESEDEDEENESESVSDEAFSMAM